MNAQLLDIDSGSFKELDQENVSDRPVQPELPKAEKYVTFDIVRPSSDPGSYGSKEDPSPFIYPCDPTDDIAHTLNPNEIVIHKQKILVVFSYPLAREHIFLLEAPRGSSGFSRAEIALTISKVYQHIYNEEEKSSQTIATNIPGMYNRTTTQGRYGIWGHSLGELIIDSIYFDQNKGLYYLSISSYKLSFSCDRFGLVNLHTLERSSSIHVLAYLVIQWHFKNIGIAFHTPIFTVG